MLATRENHKIRVMTMIDAIGFGGAEALARSVAVRLDRRRFESSFCVTRWDPFPEEDRARSELEAAGVPFLGLERSSAAALRPSGQLVTHMRVHSIDVLHTHKLGSNIWGALLAPRAGVPVLVAQEHGVAMEGLRKRAFMDRHLIARRADAFVAVSEIDRRRMIASEGIPTRKIHVIPNGIESAKTRTDVTMRAELGVPADALVVGGPFVANGVVAEHDQILVVALIADALVPWQPVSQCSVPRRHNSEGDLLS